MRAAAFVLLGLSAPAWAQQVDCAAEALTPAQLDFCAEAALVEAEAEMDEAYRLALVEAKAHDERVALEQSEVEVTLEAALRDAQAAFLDYRDFSCAAEALTVDEADQATVGLVCAARLTLRRTADLQVYGALE